MYAVNDCISLQWNNNSNTYVIQLDTIQIDFNRRQPRADYGANINQSTESYLHKLLKH